VERWQMSGYPTLSGLDDLQNNLHLRIPCNQSVEIAVCRDETMLKQFLRVWTGAHFRFADSASIG
jgi:hypothetical protein